MLVMIRRNRVKDYGTWHRTFASHREAHLAAGLRLRYLGRDVAHPDQVHFAFDVETIERAKGFIEDPANAKIGADTVIDGEYHLVDIGSDY